jgi:hypothetical protein
MSFGNQQAASLVRIGITVIRGGEQAFSMWKKSLHPPISPVQNVNAVRKLCTIIAAFVGAWRSTLRNKPTLRTLACCSQFA